VYIFALAEPRSVAFIFDANTPPEGEGPYDSLSIFCFLFQYLAVAESSLYSISTGARGLSSPPSVHYPLIVHCSSEKGAAAKKPPSALLDPCPSDLRAFIRTGVHASLLCPRCLRDTVITPAQTQEARGRLFSLSLLLLLVHFFWLCCCCCCLCT